MARYASQKLYDIVQRWKHDCVLARDSLFWPGSGIWKEKNIIALQRIMLQSLNKKKEDGSKARHPEDVFAQLNDAQHRLASELVFFYWLCPNAPPFEEKYRRVLAFAEQKTAIELNEKNKDILQALNGGFNDPGIDYYDNMIQQIIYVLNFVRITFQFDKEVLENLLSDPQKFKILIFQVQKNVVRKMRTALLHMMFPDYYERITSLRHKSLIVNAFHHLIGEDKPIPDDEDGRLFLIRKKLSELFPDKALDFYYSPLLECWEGDRHSRHIGPVQNLVMRKQLILQGGPGSGKNALARKIARTTIRRQLIATLGANWYFSNPDDADRIIRERVLHISLHSGYTYRDFIRRAHIEEDGKITWHSGLLLRIQQMLEEKKLENLRRIPFIIILDGLQHVPLHDLFGECSEQLMQREHSTRLTGDDDQFIRFPNNLYFIGTMTATSSTDDTIDVNLRRCFSWLEVNFDEQQMINYFKESWHTIRKDYMIQHTWEAVAEEFHDVAKRGRALNDLLDNDRHLTSHHQRIGHICFHDLLMLCVHHLSLYPHAQTLLFDQNGKPMHTMENFWEYALLPLLNHYTNMLPKPSITPLLQRARETFLSDREGVRQSTEAETTDNV